MGTMKKMTGRLIAFTLAILFLFSFTACGNANSQTNSGAASAEPEKVLKIAETMVDFALPGQSWGGDIALSAALYDWLVEIDEEGNLVPELASSWESTDGKTWTVKLREGVKFQDGSDFTADDLIFCVERTQDEELGHVDQDAFSVVESINKIDDYTVEFVLSEARPTFMYSFTGWNMMMLSSEYDYAEMGVTKPMGTGPFVAEEIIVGEGAVLKKNTDYWEEGLPKVDEIRYYFVGDMETRMNMLRQGKVDIVRDMAITNLEEIEKDENLKYDVPYTSFRIISMNTQTEPFEDSRVVEAMKYCIDPAVLAQVCQGTLGEDVFYNENFVAQSLKEYLEIAPREQNIEKAKELLAEAGYPDGFEIDLYYESDLDFSGPIGLALQTMAEPAGIKINLKGNARDVYLSQYWTQVDFSITSWTPKIDPSQLFQLAAYTDAPWNEMKLASPEADAILDRLLAETDEAKRQEIYDEYQTWFFENGAMVNVQVPFIVAQNVRVQNYHEPLTRIIRMEEIDIDMGA